VLSMRQFHNRHRFFIFFAVVNIGCMPERIRTELAEIGEFGLIDYLTKNNETTLATTVLSVGDDAAVIDHFGKQTVVSTDLLLEGIHFDLTYTPLKYLGFKAVAVNVSDICAMMAEPSQITMSVGVSAKFALEALEEFYDGVYEACNHYGVDLVGGDTSSSLTGFVISVTAIGEVVPDRFVTRSGAKVNDLICVTGDLGGAYLGLQLLEREKKIFLEHPTLKPQFGERRHIIRRILKPEARVDIVAWLRDTVILPTAMIDVSDGLSSELLHICKQSACGCVVYEEKIPVHQESVEAAHEFGLDPLTCALSGGEDYELLFTIAQSDYEKVKGNLDITVIGHITEAAEGCRLVSKAGKTHELKAQGWSAFR
jgi:thiamine-monophosphate kinase